MLSLLLLLLLQHLRVVCELSYGLVLFDFGTNDLAACCSAELLADRVIVVAETLLDSYGVKRVVVMKVFVPPCEWTIQLSNWV